MIYTTETKVELDSGEIAEIEGILHSPSTVNLMARHLRELIEELVQKAYDKGVSEKRIRGEVGL